jgi:ribosomal protein S21
MEEDREASFKFRRECEKYGIFPETRDEDLGESPFFGGQVPWM